MTAKYRDLLISFAVIAMGVFFLTQASVIENIQDDVVGPDFMPTILSWLMIGLGLFSGGLKFLLPKAEDNKTVESPRAALIWITNTLLLGLFYFFLFLTCGYLIASTLVLGIALFAFGVRRMSRVIPLSIIGGLTYYLIFFRLMGVYDPPGSLIDISGFLIF